ncbi:jg2502 [Pararge aegeria aegeria]|uniref:Jg2502 protein n=1 Tax=Pararge aegeria aegeria TaxID=348720 RepID=A0A8S4QY40_9NEOP|nr:jg2502 [Pararge aegeria aegeria]
MPSCVVKWCRTRSGCHSKIDGITFHAFPKNPVRREPWVQAVRLERQEPDWMPSKSSKICSIHFRDHDFYLSKKGCTMIHKNATLVCTVSILEGGI